MQKIYVEVGANDFELVQEDIDLEEEKGVLVSFEPLFDKYIGLLRRCDEETARQCAACQHRRGVVIPFAVGFEGVKEFHITRDDSCSSLLEPNKRFASNSTLADLDWDFAACTDVAETVAVPGVTLETVIGKWLEGRTVDYLKVDAQGYDLEILRSAGRFRHKIKLVDMEAPCDAAGSASRLYKAASTCRGTVEEMVRLGFQPRFDPSICTTCEDYELMLQFDRYEKL